MKKAIGILLIVILIADVAVITFAYTQQSRKLTQAGANMSILASQVNTLNGELMTLRGNVAVLQSRLSDSEANAQVLQRQLSAAQANATQLQSVLNYTNTQFAKALAGPTPNATPPVALQPMGPFGYGDGMGVANP